MTIVVAVIGLFAAMGAGTNAQVVASYVIGAQDVLTISVFDEPSLSGKYAVELDGSLSFPLIGRVKAAGLSLRDFESDLRSRYRISYQSSNTRPGEAFRTVRVQVAKPGTEARTISGYYP